MLGNGRLGNIAFLGSLGEVAASGNGLKVFDLFEHRGFSLNGCGAAAVSDLPAGMGSVIVYLSIAQKALHILRKEGVTALVSRVKTKTNIRVNRASKPDNAESIQAITDAKAIFIGKKPIRYNCCPQIQIIQYIYIQP